MKWMMQRKGFLFALKITDYVMLAVFVFGLAYFSISYFVKYGAQVEGLKKEITILQTIKPVTGTEEQIKKLEEELRSLKVEQFELQEEQKSLGEIIRTLD
jgi:hypothetical protein